ncbi:benzoate-CoA ligase family protein [Pleurocapsales cyanobacterium LEGE 10410]|nr:benzoate-CoA ligase family protein [Pleurocapsales cyanobacterium LEGE 10410]
MNPLYQQLPSIFNIAAYFLKASLNQENGERVSFYYQDEAYSYRKVNEEVCHAAGLLSELGLERENRVAILLPDSPDLVFAFWGAIWMGAIPVPINTACKLEDIQYILQDCRAKILITDRAWCEQLFPDGNTEDFEFLRQVLLTDGEDSLSQRLSQINTVPTPAPTSPDEPAFWLYTSGSTGRPKGVVHLHRSMAVCAQEYAQATIGLKPDDIVYSVAKVPFAYGLGNTLYMPMAVGAASVLTDANNVFDIIADLNRYRPTVLFAIPAIYSGILAVQEIAPLDASSLRLCVSAAEQLPKSVWHKWHNTFGLEVCEGIGTSEFLHIFLSNRSGECRPGSCGKPVPGYDVRIVDDRGFDLPRGEIGNLQVEGASLMLQYWNRHRETREVIYGNTMRTGDKYLCDEDGYFFFMGRKDDLFKVSGQWVSPFEIEDVLLQHEAVLEAAIVPESDGGQNLTQVVAYITLKSGFEESRQLKDSLRKFVRTNLPSFKAPKTIHFLDRLPRTSTGKIHRKSLLKARQLVKPSN